MRPTFLLAAPLALALAAAPVAAQQTAEAQVITPPTALSETAPELRSLFEAMQIYALLDVVALEGVGAAPEMEADMFPGQGGSAWPAVVASIYSSDRLIEAFEASVPLDRFTPEVVETLTEFFESDSGRAIADGELSARQAFLEPGVEEAAQEFAQTRAAEGDPRMEMLTTFIEANDLIERNVSGALNSNLAFYRGLVEGGAFETDIPEALMLSEVWGQEAELRADTTDWLYAYQVLAYDDLTDAQLQSYIDLSQTEAGRVLNAALFASFDEIFNSISYDLGVAAAAFISGEET